MFFWIQNGELRPRLPEVAREMVRSLPRMAAIPSEVPGAETGARPALFSGKPSDYERKEESHKTELVFAHQLMSQPVFCLSQSASFQELKDAFLEKRFRHIPIVDEKKSLVGIVSDRDFLKYSLLDEGKKMDWNQWTQKKILTARRNTEVRFAAKVMLEEHIGSLPIVDEKGQLEGIITRSDFIRAMVKFPGFILVV